MVSSRTLLAAALLALALPATAHAGTLTRTPSAITYTAAPATAAAENVFVENEGAQLKVTAGAGFGASDCPPGDEENVVLCDSSPAFLVFLLGFDDQFNAASLTGTTTIEAHGGAGNDQLEGAGNADTLLGEDGNDQLTGRTGGDTLEGAAGDDQLDGGQGDDTLRAGDGDDLIGGGDGNDTIEAGAGNEFSIDDGAGDDKVDAGPGNDGNVNGRGRDTFTGGDGTDTISYETRAAGVTITLDGQPDDGESGEGDNIAADVENATGGSGNDTIAGQQAAGTSGGYLYGMSGNDTIRGGPGADRIEGGDGDDVIDSRDGRDDSIDCGGGNDTVFGDPADSTQNCELAPDADGDGHLVPADCQPLNPLIHPAAGEVFGNAVDENCDGVASYLSVDASLTFRSASKRGPTRARLFPFRATRLLAGDRVEVRCKGSGCPFKTKAATARGGTVDIGKLLKKRYLRSGATLEVRILRANQNGKVVRYKVAKSGKITSTPLCLPFGGATPVPRCP